MNTRKVGTDKEHKAESYLTGLGMVTVERNFRTRYGEVDIIMLDGKTLVFVEVKFRSGLSAGNSLDAIDYRKRMQITRICRQYLMTHPKYYESGIRFDCIGIDGDKVSYIRNAFDIKGNAI